MTWDVSWDADEKAVEERLTVDSEPSSIVGHELRYRLAAGYLEPGDVVLDAACGTGYGAKIADAADWSRWVGVDIADCVDVAYDSSCCEWVQADLCDWRPGFPFDVGLSFETLEHVTDPEFLVATLCQARRLVICSVPLIPTKHRNPYHLHDFEPEDLPELFDGHGWQLRQYLFQPSEVSGIYVFTP